MAEKAGLGFFPAKFDHVQYLSHILSIPDAPLSDVRTTILAAWAHILSVQLASQEVIFGAILDTDVLPLRTTLSPNVTIYEYMDGFRQLTQHLSLGNSTDLKPAAERALSDSLLPTVIDLRDLASRDEHHLSNMNLEQFALAISCKIVSKNMVLFATFDIQRVPTCRAQNILRELAHVVTQLLSAPSQWTLEDIEVISPEEKTQMLAWNQRNAASTHECIHEMIALWAKNRPAAEALCAPEGSFTYADLDSLSARLAYNLQGQGVGSGDLVALCIERSALAIIAMIAVLKTGAAFIPLEAASPVGRNIEIVKQSRARKVLVSGEQLPKWSSPISILLTYDLIQSTPAPKPGSLPIVDPKSLAYVIFTSGSTGRPKGVMIEHHSLSASVRSEGRPYVFGQSTSTRALQFASLAFDASLAEHLAPLSNGGCVCIPDQATRLDALVDFMNQTRVNWAFFTPSFFRLLDPDDLPFLQTVVLGGEAITDDCIDRWAHRICLVNGYGPSETTICVTACVVYPNPRNRVSIGTGMISKLWVVNPENPDQLSPIGTAGELLIQGPTVGRGYLGDSSKTDASFIKPPRWLKDYPEHSQRIYCTGDLVRLESDGSLSYIGRRDTQVKIRGHRIELSEIESRIVLNGSVQHVAVVVPKVGALKGQLTAVLAFSAQKKQNAVFSTVRLLQESERSQGIEKIEKIEASLKSTLPNYMVPAVWIPVQAIPLSTAAKADRPLIARWLENDPEVHSFMAGRARRLYPSGQPKTEIEKILHAIWASVLDIDPEGVPVNMSLQRLGGDSLAAIQIIAKCRKQNIMIKMASLLGGDSISQLSQSVVLVTQIRVGTDQQGLFPLSPIQRVYVHHAPSEKHHFNQSLLLNVNHDIQPAQIVSAISEVVKRHPMLRVRLQSSPNGWMQEIVDGSVPTMSTHHAPESSVDQIIQSSQTRPSVTTGPILHADIIQTEHRRLLFLTAHHMAIDLVSWTIILGDLEQYIQSGKLPHVEATSFQTWCSHLQQIKPTKALPYSVPPADLDFWGMNGRRNTYGDVVHFRACVDKIATEELVQFTNSFNIHLLDVLLASLFLAFSEIFHTVPTIHNESHGREQPDPLVDISNTVGWFTTLLPIAPPINPTTNLIEACRIVQFTRKLVPRNGLAHFTSTLLHQSTAPIFEIVFNYMGSTHVLSNKNSVFQIVPHSMGVSGDSASDNMARFAMIEISAALVDQQIEFVFSCNRFMNHLKNIEKWTADSAALLTTIRDLGDATAPSVPSTLLSDDYHEACAIQNNACSALGVSACHIEAIYPASPIQNAMLMAQAASPESYQARLVLAIRCHTPFDLPRFQHAWDCITQRHSILRTVFVPRGEDKYDQVVLRDLVTNIQVKDRDAFPMDLSQSTARWDLAQPHTKLTITQTDDDIRCLLEISHALIDHVALTGLLNHLAQLYLCSPNTLPEQAEPPYSLLIAHLAEIDPLTSIEYWRSVFPTPLYHKDKPVSSRLCAENKSLRRMPIAISTHAKTALASSDYTPSTIFRLCWGLTLQRYTGSTSPQFGYVLSGRDIPIADVEVDKIIGPFLNIVPCRFDLTSYKALDNNLLATDQDERIATQETTKSLLQTIQSQYLASLSHQHHFFTYASQLRREQNISIPPTRLFFDTVVNFRRHVALDEYRVGSDSIVFDLVDEYDPFDHDIVLEIDHTADNDFTVQITSWRHRIGEEDAKTLVRLFLESVERVCLALH